MREIDLSPGSAVGLFGVAREGQTLFFTDMGRSCIHVCLETGAYIRMIDLRQWGQITDISVVGNELYVILSDMKALMQLTLNENYLAINSTGISLANTNLPNTVNVFGSTIMVTAWETDNVLVFTTSLNTMFNYNGTKPGPGQLMDPFGGHIDQWGRSIVSDRENRRIVLISANGTYMRDLVTAADGLVGKIDCARS